MNRLVPEMKLPRCNFLIILVIFLIDIPARAQESKVTRDLELWTGVEIEKEFLKDWQFSLKQEFRFKKNISEINNFFTQAGLKYTINKNFSLEGKYRYIRNRKSDGLYENRSRYSFDLNYKGKMDFITVKYRLRYLKEVESMHLLSRTEQYEKYFRHRVIVEYNDFRKVEPFLSGEIFQLHELYQYPEWKWFVALTGIRYKMQNIGELKFAYGFGRELNSTVPYCGFLVRVNYIYEF
jgi:hypothetical protein